MPVTSNNPSAQSSTNSLHAPQHQLTNTSSPAMHPSQGLEDVTERPVLETIPSQGPAPVNNDATPPATQTPRPDNAPIPLHFNKRPEEHSHVSDKTLKPTSPPESLHSHSSFNDQSDADHGDESVGATEQREKLSRWKRLSRHRESSQNYSHHALSPRKGLGSDAGAAASTSSVGSASRPPRKSFTGDSMPVGSESTLVGTHSQPSNDGSAFGAGSEEKKGPLGWIKSKMREKREESKEKEAEKERNKSPPASTDRLHSVIPGRGKSMDIKRDELPEKTAQEPHSPQQQPHQSPPQHPQHPQKPIPQILQVPQPLRAQPHPPPTQPLQEPSHQEPSHPQEPQR